MEITILFSGDIVFDNEVEKLYLDKHLTQLFQECDYTVANLEAPIIKTQDTPRIKAGPAIF